MMTLNKETVIQKIIEMPAERVSKVLIFMAGMEAEHIIDENSNDRSCSEHEEKSKEDSYIR